MRDQFSLRCVAAHCRSNASGIARISAIAERYALPNRVATEHELAGVNRPENRLCPLGSIGLNAHIYRMRGRARFRGNVAVIHSFRVRKRPEDRG
jgi:hypothetical protein